MDERTPAFEHNTQELDATTLALKHSREELEAILRTAVDAIVTIDAKGVIQSTNEATEKMFGFRAAEMIGQNVKMLMPAPYRQEHDQYLADYERTGVKKIIGIGREAMAQRKDGSTFPVELAVSQVDHRKLYMGILRDVSRRKELEREVLEIAGQEQRRIGQDLHDSVGQELTALNLLAGDLAETLRTNPEQGAKLIERLGNGLRRSQKELRAIMRGLLPVAVDSEGLMAALSDLADRTDAIGDVHCRFDCPKPVSLSDNLTATHLYLIAQEAVHNAIKHAQPQNIRISLESNEFLILRVRDDGIGMNESSAGKTEGLGLRIMRNRAAFLGAKLTIQPVEPNGTSVTCTLWRKHETENPGETSPDPDRR